MPRACNPWRFLWRFPAVLAAVLGFTMGWSAFSQQGSPPDSGRQVLEHASAVLRWYRQWNGADIALGRAGDELYVETGKSVAEQIVRLEFQSALAQTVLIKQAAQPANTSAVTPGSIDTGTIVKTQQNLDLQIQALRTNLSAANRKISLAPARKRAALINQRDTLQRQLDLALALQENLQKITAFMTTTEKTEGAASGLTQKIMALQQTVPSLQVSTAEVAKTKSVAPVAAAPPAVIENQHLGTC